MMDNSINSSHRIFGLDMMRAIAILMVLFSHLLWVYPISNHLIYQIFTLFGFLGVEIFFVLSGFLIGKILYKMYVQENDFTIHSVFYFLKRRWFRTLPNYFLVLVLNIAIAIFIGYSISDVGYCFLFLQNFATTMPAFFTESWSLSIEEFAYFFVPVALLIGTTLIKTKNKSKRFISIITFLIIVFIINKVIYHYTTLNTSLAQWNLSLKAVVIYRIDSILVGMASSCLSLNYANFWKKRKTILAFSGCVLIVLMFIGIGFFRILIDAYPFFWNVLYLPITSVTFALFLPLSSEWKSAP